MSKFKIFIITLFTCLLISVTVAVVYQNIKYDELAKSEEKVEDECIYETFSNDVNEIEASYTEPKISPNASLTIKRYYKECGHTTSEYKNVSEDMVNKTREELQNMYPDFTIEEFSETNIVLQKQEEGRCDEHFVVKDENSNIMIYKENQEGVEELYQNTGISTEYLPETDKINLRNGVKVFGIENLNAFIENFE